MTDQTIASDDPETPADATDGTVDYSQYSTAQLHALRERLDARQFPQNAHNLHDEIAAREARSLRHSRSGFVCEGRFTRFGGWGGWFAAKLHRRLVYGAGAIETRPDTVALLGWQRTWLGVAMKAEVAIPTEQIRNVARVDASIRFDVDRQGLVKRRIEFVANSAEAAARLVESLPTARTSDFDERWNDVRDFQRRLRETGTRIWMTPALVLANLAVFVAMAISTKQVLGFDLPTLWAWGANFGPLTTGGQWWRLLTALFIHYSIVHLLVNLWVLWNIGRRTEQLFGNFAAMAIYFGAGVIAGLTSIVWAPTLSSVGASGAIFGLIGAYIAFLLRPGCGVPRSIARRHWLSTIVFALYSLYAGATNPSIDNAAHVGGLVGGLVIGWCLARPLESDRRVDFPHRQVMAAAAFFVVAVIGAFGWIHGKSPQMSPPDRYLRAHAWYVLGQDKNLREWQALGVAVSAGAISDAQLGQRFQSDILPFWKTADARITSENRTLTGPERPYALLVGHFVRLRVRWAKALIAATLDQDPAALATAQKLMKETNRTAAQLNLMAVRANMAQRARPLSEARPIVALRSLFQRAYSHCVTAPPGDVTDFDPKDDATDGPSLRHAIGCRAQRLFMAGDYRDLEGLMRKVEDPRDRLPDGTSRLSGLVAGIDALMSYGGLSIQEVLARTADWRRSIRNPVNADLVEADALENWAWSARGHGYANAVMPGQMALFNFRVEMAAADLADIAIPAQTNPLWYQWSLNNRLDDSETAIQMRSRFEAGRAKFPRYWPMYQAMLRALMPRWGGSYGQVDGFILAMSVDKGSRFDAARYARLYTMYSDLEGPDFDPFTAVPADWSTMKAGYDELIARYPHSEYLLNRYDNFACRARDRNVYRRLRTMIGRRVLPSVWTKSYTLAKCDAGSKTWPDGSPAEASRREMRSRWIDSLAEHSLGPIALGMTKQQLLGAVGKPLSKDRHSWTYNSIDDSHDGVLSVYFTTGPDPQESRVYAIEYFGDRASSPHQIAYLKGLSKAQLLDEFNGVHHKQRQTTSAICEYFANGVFACLRHGVVKSYGMELVKPF